MISGITTASISTAMAYIADVTAPEKRAGAFGLVGGAFGLGFIIGPAVGGLLGAQDPRLPFWIAAAVSLANATYGFFILPESLPREKRKPFTFGRANPVGSLMLLRSHPQLKRLATIQFTGYLAHEVFEVFVLYAIYRYAWDTGKVGLSLAFVGLCAVAISAGAVQPIVARIGERRTLYLGQLFGGFGMIIGGLASTGTLYLLAIPVMMIWTMSGPAAQGLMTHRVSASQQGELQGAISSMRAVAMCLGPALFTFTFAYFIDPASSWHVPGAPWFLAALLLFVAAVMATRVKQPRMKEEPPLVIEPTVSS